MRVVVVSPFEAGSSYAHAINTVKMAEGFARLGHEVFLITQKGGNQSYQDLKDKYGLSHDIGWYFIPRKLMCLPIDSHYLFGLLSQFYIRKISPDLVYSRSYIAPVFASKLGFPVVAETHAHVNCKTYPFRMMMHGTQNKNFKAISTISQRLKNYYMTLGVKEEKIIVLPDSVDIGLFEPSYDIGESPYKCPKPNIVYCGHLYDYKGIPTVLEATVKCPDYNFHFVGGREEDIIRHRSWLQENRIHNVFFHGMKPFSDVPKYLWHADVLLLPPSANHPSAQWTSPVKLGEYCASKRPIIASDIPALKDWLSDREVYFFKADDTDSLICQIKSVIQADIKEKELKIDNAFRLAQNLTYEKRASEIIRKATQEANNP